MTDAEKHSAVHRISAETGLCPRTVLSVIEGRRVRLSTRTAVEMAANKLGIRIASEKPTDD